MKLSARNLPKLKEGADAYAVIKASNVMIAVDDEKLRLQF